MKTTTSSKKSVAPRKSVVISVPARKATKAPVTLKRILVPVDFSEPSMKAVPYALAFAKQFKAELVLVHIVEQVVYPGDWMIPPFPTGDFASESREQLMAKLRSTCTEKTKAQPNNISCIAGISCFPQQFSIAPYFYCPAV